jgi:very-short-patch-repair endonuclease
VRYPPPPALLTEENPITEFFNRRPEKEKRLELRRTQTPAEARLWELLRDRQSGPKWRRQYSAGVYILDFYCPSARLAVELDGPSHEGNDAQAYDAARTESLASVGITVLRFSNAAVFRSLDTVLAAVLAGEVSPCLAIVNFVTLSPQTPHLA